MALLERHFKMSLTLVLFKSAIFCLVYKLPLFSQVKKYPTFPTLCPYSAVADLPPETALATPIAKGCCWQANQELLPGTSPTATSSSYLYRLHKVTLEKLHNPWFWKPTQEKVVWWGWVQILTLSLVLQMVASLSLSSFIFNLGLWFFFFFFLSLIFLRSDQLLFLIVHFGFGASQSMSCWLPELSSCLSSVTMEQVDFCFLQKSGFSRNVIFCFLAQKVLENYTF